MTGPISRGDQPPRVCLDDETLERLRAWSAEAAAVFDLLGPVFEGRARIAPPPRAEGPADLRRWAREGRAVVPQLLVLAARRTPRLPRDQLANRRAGLPDVLVRRVGYAVLGTTRSMPVTPTRTTVERAVLQGLAAARAGDVAAAHDHLGYVRDVLRGASNAEVPTSAKQDVAAAVATLLTYLAASPDPRP